MRTNGTLTYTGTPYPYTFAGDDGTTVLFSPGEADRFYACIRIDYDDPASPVVFLPGQSARAMYTAANDPKNTETENQP